MSNIFNFLATIAVISGDYTGHMDPADKKMHCSSNRLIMVSPIISSKEDAIELSNSFRIGWKRGNSVTGCIISM
jgi:hypothetical protein